MVVLFCLIQASKHCRKQRPELLRRSFMDNGAMSWHGVTPYEADWSEETRLVAFTVSSPSQGGLYCAFNTSHKAQTLQLPHWPGLVWQPLMDTGKGSAGSALFLHFGWCFGAWKT